jgi:hypothetical protein
MTTDRSRPTCQSGSKNMAPTGKFLGTSGTPPTRSTNTTAARISAGHSVRKIELQSNATNDMRRDDEARPGAIDTSDRLIHGSLLKCVDGRWTSEGVEVTGSQLLALHCVKALQRWEAQKPIETIVEAPDAALPDVEELNAAIPRETWEDGLDGKPKPPWQLQYVVFLLDISDASLCTFANSTVGAKLAYERLTDRVSWMRSLRGANVLPLVQLDAKPMKTKTGPKQRPEFTIIDWRDLSGGPAVAQQQPQRAIEAKPAALKPAPVGKPVKAPTSTEMLDDEIPF